VKIALRMVVLCIGVGCKSDAPCGEIGMDKSFLPVDDVDDDG